jgi:hypothetical protein
MLPSFRLIAATFLCGFVVVFAGLRLAASLNDIHEGLPVLAAHAAPVSITPVADSEARRGLAAVPVMYDLRFAIGTVAPTPVRLPAAAFESPAPPISIVPPEDVDSESSRNAVPETAPAEETAEAALSEATVAAIPPAAPVIAESAAIPDEPAVAAIDSPANSGTEHPAAVTAAPATQATADEPQATPAIEQSPPDLEPGAVPAETPAAPGPKPRSPAASLRSPKIARTVSKAAKPHAAKSLRRARVKVARKKQIRVAHRAAATASPANSFGSVPFGLFPAAAQR